MPWSSIDILVQYSLQMNEVSDSSVRKRLSVFDVSEDTKMKHSWTLDFSWDICPENAASNCQEITQPNDSKKVHWEKKRGEQRGEESVSQFWLEPIFPLLQGMGLQLTNKIPMQFHRSDDYIHPSHICVAILLLLYS